jgi:hypothetical protein
VDRYNVHEAGCLLMARRDRTPAQGDVRSSIKMADHYTRQADQRRIAESAMRMLAMPEQTSTEIASHFCGQSSGTFSEKT